MSTAESERKESLVARGSARYCCARNVSKPKISAELLGMRPKLWKNRRRRIAETAISAVLRRLGFKIPILRLVDLVEKKE